MLRTKAEVSEDLGISERTRQRLCLKLHEELSKLGYEKNSNFMNNASALLLAEHLEAKKAAKYAKRAEWFVSKTHLAVILGVTTRTLYNWIHKFPEVISKLIAVGYNPLQKGFTEVEQEIIKEYWSFEIPNLTKSRQNNEKAEKSRQNNEEAEESRQNNEKAESEE